ncbi:RIP metalloprotease RseP [Thiomicrorhabdus indica]|uniref:RIP metalloprotease RseP n=1 Tax=Thiomicrorhabdus indica TaxID=2267253 RepID=UPI002AA6AA1F|nr:RIP metalloprotease RseP [Thiomicrorhabdus indica]
MDFFWSLVGFILVMGLIVTIHEYGHFQVARWFNIKVTDFSVGFGKALYQKQFGEVAFKIGMIPLGGYVKFVDEREGPVETEDLTRAFNRQSVYKRFAVVAAGPLINLILAWLVFASMQVIGMNTVKPLINESTLNEIISDNSNQPSQTRTQQNEERAFWELVEVNGHSVASWQNTHQQVLLALIANKAEIELVLNRMHSEHFVTTKVSLSQLDINNTNQHWLSELGLKPAVLKIDAIAGQVITDGPADLAGIQPGDKLIRFNQIEIDSWQDFVNLVQQHPNQNVSLEIKRNDVQLRKTVRLSSVSEPETGELVGRIGLGVDASEAQMEPYMNKIQMGVTEALDYGFNRSVDLIIMSIQMVKRMILGEVSVSHLSGPISIAQFSGQAVQNGLISFLGLLALLSLSIGFLNLLPIPVLDGGHLLYYLVEMIKGSPVSDQVQVVGQNIGLFLILSLTLLALFNDVIRLSNG